ncbi:class I SAM-dependent methyltransferase [Tianweitania sp. BSSL-BM11]|uniref:Class I SAM-dependent methyltransferase n=1 Tax=Tianweitania aestuarii TaxID=2814886 RepID=A0ABS5RSF4_9HYPH|nr:cyclopropane-fatty-acyl-phospholipid synthase family protein [Tianweitania aestuarii]MBS9719985.1 class I SAM-dependent methyltransferase [Tianweitania aestuarii]
MNRLLRSVIESVVKTGDLTITDPEGVLHHFGDRTGSPVHVLIKTKQAERAIAFDPTLHLAEAFMDEEVDFLQGDVLALLKLLYNNSAWSNSQFGRSLDLVRNLFKRFQQLNSQKRSRENVHRHYDLSGELYKLFLDEDMQYSCAYFERPDMTLEEAQAAKKRHIAAKLDLKPGQNVLDIGSGWGGMGLYLARDFGVDVLGVTLSTEQHAVSTERVHDEALENHVHFELRDYRSLSERFDRIVSVGMFEHVGVNHFKTFFDTAATLLKPDGVMVLHSIGRNGPPYATNPFIRKYIFPGGYIPSLSEVLPFIERAGLMVTDIEILRHHYADTLKAWRERFLLNRERAKAIYDERFCRMWEFYLSGSEAAFRWQDMMVFQIQITKRNDVLPVTRDYIYERDHATPLPLLPESISPRRQRTRKRADQD